MTKICMARSLPALLTYELADDSDIFAQVPCFHHVCGLEAGHFHWEPPKAHRCRTCGHFYLWDLQHPGDGGVRRPDRQAHRGRYCCCVKGSGCEECGT